MAERQAQMVAKSRSAAAKHKGGHGFKSNMPGRQGSQGRTWRMALAFAFSCSVLLVGVPWAVADESPFSSTQASQHQLELALEAGNERVDFGDTHPVAAEEMPKSNLGRTEAQELLASVFETQIEGDAAAFGSLDIQKYLSNYVALVKPEVPPEGPLLEPEGQGGPKNALVESTLPLRTEDSSGETAEVSLALEREGDDLAPVNPLTEVEIPEELGEGVRLPEAGVSIELADAPSERAPSQIEEATAFYPNVATDTDFSVQPTATGVETLTQLRSSAAPTRQEFSVDMPGGATLVETEQGGAEVSSQGETIVSVAPPVAIDSTGAEVPASLEVAGDSIVVRVSPGESTAYPVLVDPTWDYYQWDAGSAPAHQAWEGFNTTSNNTWQLWMSSPWGGLWGPTVITGYPGEVVSGTQANWSYHVPRWREELEAGREPTSFIQKVSVYGLELWMQGNPGERRDSPYMLIGIWDPFYWHWSAVGYRNGIEGGLQGWTGYFYAENELHEVDSHARWFQVGFASSENGANDNRWLTDQGVMVELMDNDFPSVERTAGPSKWVNQSSAGAPITFEASDSGLGLYDINVGEPTVGGGVDSIGTRYGDCTGGATHPCPRTWSNQNGPQLNYDPSVMPTGEDVVTINAIDPLGHESTWQSGTYKPREINVKVDHTAPQLSLSGSATEQATLGTGRQTYTLNVNATDGTAEHPQSGVAKVAIEVDGKVKEEWNEGCSGRNCALNNAEWKLKASEYSAGKHTIAVTAEDAVGNKAVPQTVTVEMHPVEAPTLSLSGTLTEQAALGTTRPRYKLKLNATASGEPPAASEAIPTYLTSFGTGGSEEGQLSTPAGVAVNSKGETFVADRQNNRIEVFNAAGEFIRQFGSAGSGLGQMSEPVAVALDGKGNVYVADRHNVRIDKFGERGEYIAQFGAAGTGSGQFATVSGYGPEGVAVDAKGNVLVSDTHGGRIEKFNEKGEYLSAVGTKGTGTGQLQEPAGLTVGPGGNVWVADWSNNKVVEFNETGTYVRQFGKPGAGNGEFNRPDVVTVDGAGDVFVADENNNRVQEFNEKGEYAHQFGAAGSGTGRFSFSFPMGITVDTKGNIYVSDPKDNRVEKWGIPAFVPSYASSIGSSGAGASQFNHPSGVARDTEGNIWALDENNSRLEEFTETGTYLGKFSTFGTGEGLLNHPTAIAAGPKNVVYVADTGNKRINRYVKGSYSGVFGSAGTGNGQFAGAGPEGVATESAGNVWVSDTYGGRIEKFNESGVFQKAIGTKGTGASQIGEPMGLSVTGTTVFVADWQNNRVDVLNGETGAFLRSIGTAGARNGQMLRPDSVSLDGKGHLFVADTGNHRVDEFTEAGEYIGQFGSKGTGNGQFGEPTGVLADANGNVWVADSQSTRTAAGAQSSSLVAAYSLDQGSGATAVDDSGNAHEGTIEGGTEWSEGKFGKDLKLNGSTGCVKVPDSNALDLTGGEFTLSAWVRPEGNDNSDPIFFKEAEGAFSYTLYVGLASGHGYQPEASIEPHIYESKTVEGPKLVTPNTWTNMALTYDGKTERLYVNGQLADSEASGNPLNSSGPLLIGCAKNWGDGFNGQIDNARIYSKALNASELAEDEETALTPKPRPALATYSFDQGSALDDTGNGHEGTLEGGIESVEGKFGKDLKFNGSTGCVKVPDSNALDLAGEFTLSAWVKPEGTDSSDPIFFKEDESAFAYTLYVGLQSGHGYEPEASIAPHLYESKTVEGTKTVSANTWTNMALTYDGKTERLYVNGVPVDSEASANPINSSGPLLIGCAKNWGDGFTGQIDNARIYPRALSTAELTQDEATAVPRASKDRIERWLQTGSSKTKVSTEITVDGKVVDTSENWCLSASCSLTRPWTMNASAFSATAHTIVAKVFDGFGGTASKTLTVSIAKDKVKPSIETGGELASAPEGWVEQKSYGLYASATDATGYGVTSLAFEIDGQTVESTKQSCPEGGCPLILQGQINMEPYSGGAHSGELVATDGAGNVSVTQWTINVDPNGEISAGEAEATLEAVEATSPVNPVGPVVKEGEEEYLEPGLGLTEEESRYVASGSPTPTTISGVTGVVEMQIPNAATFAPTCGEDSEESLTQEEPCISSAKREELEQLAEEAESAGLAPAEVTPLETESDRPRAKLVGEEVMLTPNTDEEVDETIRPLEGGALAFNAIRAADAPEEYSWRVQLEPGQELRQVSSQEVAAYWGGEHLALDFFAEPAADAIGTAVPTELKMSGKDVITEIVHHRSQSPGGGSFVYPVVAGTGWLGGLQTYQVEMPPPEQPETEGEEEWLDASDEAGSLRVSLAQFGAPEAGPGTTLKLTQSEKREERQRAFNFNECRFLPYDQPPNDPGGHPGDPIPPELRRALATRCHGNSHDEGPLGHFALSWAVSIYGKYSFIPDKYSWLLDAPKCKPPWGPNVPVLKHCDGPVELFSPKVSIFEQVRFAPGDYEPDYATGQEVCGQLEGVLPDRWKLQESGRKPLEETKHWRRTPVWKEEACPWGHF